MCMTYSDLFFLYFKNKYVKYSCQMERDELHREKQLREEAQKEKEELQQRMQELQEQFHAAQEAMVVFLSP